MPPYIRHRGEIWAGIIDGRKNSQDEVSQPKDPDANGDGRGKGTRDGKEEDDKAGEEQKHGNMEWQWDQPNCM